MPDSETPQHDSPVPADPGEASSAIEAQSTDGGSLAVIPPSSRADLVGRVKGLARGRTAIPTGVALLCVVAGTVGSVFGAQAVARNDAAKARQAFPRTSAAVASTLKQALQHEEDLIISASTFFAGNEKASAAAFDTWVKWAQALRTYPELQKLGLVALVRPSELATFEARITGQAVRPLRSRSSLESRSPLPGDGGLRVVPAGKRPLYCFAAVELARGGVRRTRAGRDYCALTSGLLASRDSTLSIYAPASAGRSQGLAIETPVYRGNLPPSTFTSRRGAFVGWLREVLVPGVMLAQVVRAHTEFALRLRHRTSSSSVVFAIGTARPGAQSMTVNLHNGWTVRTFGPSPAGTGVLADGKALAWLIAGTLLSVLLGLVVFILGTARARALPLAPSPRTRRRPHEDLYDALTGLPNRALMLDRAERMLARAGRDSGLLVGALFIDIDWFKDVNDKLGHGAGDQLLTIAGERLAGVIRAHDSVGRLQGDEFVVLVESRARNVRLDSLARRVIEALHEPVGLDGFGLSFYLTASIGVAFGQYETPDDLLRDARVALLAAKAAGKDRYTVFNANMRSVIEGRGEFEIELNTALADKQFFLLYEPIYDLQTQKVAALEPVIRWLHPTRGVLEAAEFLPQAEDTRLIVPIGRWVLEEACSRAASWNVAGHRVGISVKISANQLNRDGFATDVRRALQQSGLEPSLLTLEIAETTVMRDVEAAAGRLREIKQLGVRIAIDGVGSAHANHADLQRLPLDFLKVDRGSLAASDDEDYRSWLLEAILIVGRDLSLTVIATGIETHEQLSALRGLGCTMFQGSFVGQPTPADAVASLLDADLPAAPGAPKADVGLGI